MKTATSQRGIALPIMLIMLAVMMVSSIYLLKSSTSTTLTTSNLAYDAAMTKAADAGLHAGFTYLRNLATKADLLADQPAAGYVATLSPAWTASTPNFWLGSVTLPADADGNRVEYVIHRLCDFPGAYDTNNKCQTSAPRTGATGPRALGETLRVDAPNLATAPQLHYVVTARVFGPRGGHVVTQAVIMKGP
ncbi:pilus assembly PilX family protein [Duganella sp. P38]|uniref:pilus assembly PilX family protein n=1 Tax=Duganella sp. P38 TaxID=3423949 RepID=UPI003D7B1D4D